ncbi:MAG: site-specific DNA-methyltransferase [Chloroflexi bacterium]|nr:site-specific DNA-methyltransferase [Chloroflexota bacterium]
MRPYWVSLDEKSGVFQTDAIAFLESLEPNSVDCIWTDPPYLLSNDGMTCVAGKRVPVNKGEWDRSQGIERDHEFNLAWLRACHRALKPAGTIWVTGTAHVYLSVGMAMLQLGFRILNDITWEKPNPPPNLGCRCFAHSTETILWATKAPKGSQHKHTFHYKTMKEENGGKQMKTVWRFTAPGKSEKLYGKHPTQKPVALIDRCLRASTNPGDLVVDPFAGSGATAVAAHRLDRRFLVSDRDPEYAALTVRRIEAESADLSLLDSHATSSADGIVPSVPLEPAASIRQRLLETDNKPYTPRPVLSPVGV